MDEVPLEQIHADFNRPLPWTVPLLAYAMLLGASGAIGWAVAHESFWAAAGALAAVGLSWGVLAKRQWARRSVQILSLFGVALGGGIAVITLLPAVLAIALAIAPNPESPKVSAGWVVASLGGAALAVAGCVALRALDPLNVAKQYSTLRILRPSGQRWRLSLRALMLAMPLVATAAAVYRAEAFAVETLRYGSQVRLADGGSGTYEVSYRRRKIGGEALQVDFACFADNPTDESFFGLDASRDGGRFTVAPTFGPAAEVESTGQLFDYRDGQLFPHEGHVSPEEFVAFVRSQPKEATAAALVEFAEKRRAQAAVDPAQ